MENLVRDYPQEVIGNGVTKTFKSFECGRYNALIVSLKTDQSGILYVDFSIDNTNWDSTLTYQISAGVPEIHKLAIGRKYFRIRFLNDSGFEQTYFRMQSIIGEQTTLTAPLNLSLQNDADSIVIREVEERTDIAMGRRSGTTLWNKFGYNSDIDSASTEVLASFGGTFTPLVTASTLRFVSTSANDTSGGTGANSLIVWGVDANRDEQIEIVTLNGTTNVDTVTTWLGINRVSIYLSGSTLNNVGTITITAVTGGSTQAEMPIGQGTTQQCILFIPNNHTALMDWMLLNTLKQGGGASPVVTVKGWVFSAVANSKYEVFRAKIDTSVENTLTISPRDSFVVGEKSVFWLEVSTDKDNTEIQGRFSATTHQIL